MKHMLLVMTLTASSAVAQEFASHASAKLLHDIEKTKGLIQKYGDDPTRAGIYKAELSLLYLKLALGDVHGAGASTPLPNATMTEAERGEKQARLRNEIDPLRAGIYAAELGLLQARLALENASGAR